MDKTKNKNLPLILIGGQTATGKSEIAIELARQLDAEIISVDSMQVYRGMDIGTAKPSKEERELIPHHLIDILDITESFNAAEFVRLANEKIAEIKSRNKNIIMCGGTGLYFKAFLEGLGKAPPQDKHLRAELESVPLEILLSELKEKDPQTYLKIDRNNPRRVIRAVEVLRLTGKPFSELRSEWNKNTAVNFLYVFVGLKRDSSDLRQRINERVDKMFKLGIVEETGKLLELGLEQNPTAMQAIGYKQVVEHLRGLRSLEETINLVKIRTWQYARRQSTWFKYQANMEWIKIDKNELEEPIKQILKIIREKVRNTDSADETDLLD